MKFRAIRENHLYNKAYSKGKRAVFPTIAVYVLPDYAARRLRRAHPMHINVNRIGITASKKLGGAVARNRAKRVIREAYRSVAAAHRVKTGFLIVIAAREPATRVKSTQVSRELYAALGRLDMLVQS